MSSKDIHQEIERIRKKMGRDMVILGHHYQSDQIVRHTDIQGDSLELARKITALEARYIVFCGVHFMAETAAVLAGSEQSVFLPDHGASCVMADTAPGELVQRILTRLNAQGKKIIPVAYVNSGLDIKELCGEFGGSVCTSANAAKMLAWALEEGDGVLFLPDRHLGINTANDLGIPEKERQILDIRSAGGNIDFSAAAAKKMLFWPGVCAVHHRLKPKYLHRVRVNDPEAKIIVHPECSPEVVEIADSKGSTSTIINYVQQAPAGSTIYVGTEDNLVRRLAADFAPNKAIRPLFPTYCSNMAKITPEKLLDTLQDLDPINRVEVDPNMALQARKALETMLKVCF